MVKYVVSCSGHYNTTAMWRWSLFVLIVTRVLILAAPGAEPVQIVNAMKDAAAATLPPTENTTIIGRYATLNTHIKK